MNYLNYLLTTFIALFLTGALYADGEEGYQKPPKEILDLVESERPPTVRLDSKNETLFLYYNELYKSLEELNEPQLKLAGLRINPITNGESVVKYITNIKIKKVGEQREREILNLPQIAKISNIKLSPNEKRLAFTNTTQEGIELWVVEIEEGSAKKISEATVNGAVANPYSWRDDNSLLVRMVPKEREPLLDGSKTLPTSPIIMESDGKKRQNRTYQDLLKNSIDEYNFERLLTSELYLLNLEGESRKVLGAALYINEQLSPDGNYLLATTVERPYSYLVPMSRFAQKTTLYTIDGEMIEVINSLALREGSATGGADVKRALSWRADRGATLFYVKSIPKEGKEGLIADDDGNDQEEKEEKEEREREELFLWEAPFESEPLSLLKIKGRFSRVNWGDEKSALLIENYSKEKMTKSWLFNPSILNSPLRAVYEVKSDDIYLDPGKVATMRNSFGRQVMRIEGGAIYFIGEGVSAEGNSPFVDRVTLKNLKKERIYQSKEEGVKEEIVALDKIKKGTLIVKRESSMDYPNLYIKNFKSRREELTPITNFQNPFEGLAAAHKELIKYRREDGVELSGMLYLPANYDREGEEKLPLLIWAYPREYDTPQLAAQAGQNENSFISLPASTSSFVYWVTRGYAVLQGAAFPIIGGEGKEPNDTFIEQLVMNAKAAIDAVDSLGYIDRERVGVGGHSYGAFMTAHLLSNSSLFACGVARSGAYNRTLTPFGFQNEKRNFWKAPQLYNEISPFMSADRMKSPILLIHGEADNNSGTFTLQSERYFQALKALGGDARLVILPLESHGYVAKENILHLLWEEDRFLEKHLKK